LNFQIGPTEKARYTLVN